MVEGPGINSRAKVNEVRLFGGLAARSGSQHGAALETLPCLQSVRTSFFQPMNLFMVEIAGAYGPRSAQWAAARHLVRTIPHLWRP